MSHLAVLKAAAAAASSTGVSTAQMVLFWIVGIIAVLAALGLIFARRAVYAAGCLIVTMVCLAVLYVSMDAPFLGIAQVVVYTGAIMMLFVFVLMLVGVDVSDSFTELIRGQRAWSIICGLGLVLVLGGVAWRATLPATIGFQKDQDNITTITNALFGDFPFTLEVTGTLLIVAALGAVTITHRQRLTARRGQAELAVSRVAAGTQVSPLPAPGVYAGYNASDVPALDPSGNVIEQSVPEVIRLRGQVRRIEQFEQAQLPSVRPGEAALAGAPARPKPPSGTPPVPGTRQPAPLGDGAAAAEPAGPAAAVPDSTTDSDPAKGAKEQGGEAK
ncbi:MAG: NADH-quinone oxidoreductase subunit J [Bifidobacteriaceae bacterium]|jgi:NADH-quinone oxidoreductase subunit J|nr:NADH-quinone oxidoreductase subunit J [Bifidobacteriaceae bacterium]